MDLDRRRLLLPNLTHSEYPVTPEAAQRGKCTDVERTITHATNTYNHGIIAGGIGQDCLNLPVPTSSQHSSEQSRGRRTEETIPRATPKYYCRWDRARLFDSACTGVSKSASPQSRAEVAAPRKRTIPRATPKYYCGWDRARLFDSACTGVSKSASAQSRAKVAAPRKRTIPRATPKYYCGWDRARLFESACTGVSKSASAQSRAEVAAPRKRTIPRATPKYYCGWDRARLFESACTGVSKSASPQSRAEVAAPRRRDCLNLPVPASASQHQLRAEPRSPHRGVNEQLMREDYTTWDRARLFDSACTGVSKSASPQSRAEVAAPRSE
ncbi:hypothetical protein J6590_038706 [Homalodisca vitripennis]|nr:hypothetical protein J6590_038706 [Homalodisca vitripennis]